MGSINDKLATLYQSDLVGIEAIKDVDTTMGLIGREARGLLIYTDMVQMEREKAQVESLFQQLDEELARCGKSLFH